MAIAYLYEHKDAEDTRARIEQLGRRCLTISADLRSKSNCEEVARLTVQAFGQIDILVNNIGVSYPQFRLTDITEEQLEDTFRTNIYSFFFLSQAALPYLKPGSAIINTASIVAYRGQKELIDYSCSKGAVVSFTRSLALSLVDQGIRVNAVSPGPIWTPLISSTFPVDYLITFGTETPMKRAGQTLHVNGGDFVTT